MNCLTFRRAKLAVPHDASPALLEHARTCADCAEFARELEGYERALHETVQVPVPEGLAEQIILRHRKPRWFDPQWFDRRYLALAATVVMAVAAALGYNTITSSREELAHSLIAHVVSEPTVLQSRDHIELARLEEAFSQYGGHLREPIGEVRHVGRCPIDGTLTHHIVVQTPHGRATLILIPERRATLGSPLTSDGFAVVIMALPRGSLGIVTDSAEQTTQVRYLLEKRVRRQSY